jgi:hypothetical protein
MLQQQWIKIMNNNAIFCCKQQGHNKFKNKIKSQNGDYDAPPSSLLDSRWV